MHAAGAGQCRKRPWEVRRMDAPDVWVAKDDGSDIASEPRRLPVSASTTTAISPHGSATAKGQP